MDPEMISMLTQAVGSLGFPIAACAYMATTMNKSLQANTQATNALAALVQRLMDKAHFESGDEV